MANLTGKKARKTGGNRHACRRSKKKAGSSRYALKRQRWAQEEQERTRHKKGGAS